MKHGSYTIESAVHMFRAIEAGGAAPFVRIPDSSPETIGKLLDAGAVGIVAPGISSAGQIRDVIAATRYSPQGIRGACPAVRALGHGLVQWTDYTPWAAKNIMVVALVESAEGIRNFEDIVRVDGLHAVTVGPFDLSVSLGLAGQYDHPDVVAKQVEMAKIAQRHGVDSYGHVFAMEAVEVAQGIRNCNAMGARLISIGSDGRAVTAAYSGIAEVLGN